MRDSMEIAKLGGSQEWSVNEDNYTVPIAMRPINKTVADLYAKNPTARAKRRKRLDGTLWDGKPESYLQAAGTAMEGDQNAIARLVEGEGLHHQHQTLARNGRATATNMARSPH